MFKVKVELELLLDNQSIDWVLVTIRDQLEPKETVKITTVELLDEIKEVKHDFKFY